MEVIFLKLNETVPENFTGVARYESGILRWYKEGARHRLDGPAVEYPSGEKYWYIEGKLHRTDGPAVEISDGHKEFWIDHVIFFQSYLTTAIETSIFLGKEKGKYDLLWLRFLTENGMKEYPFIPGMEEDEKIACFISKFVDLKGENKK